MTLAHTPSTPDRFQIVTEGTLRPGDLVWNPFDKTWGGPTKDDLEALGRNISFYYAVCRKLKRKRKAMNKPVTIEQMINEGSCTAAWAQQAGYRWEAVVIGGDALAKREKWLTEQPRKKTANK